MSRIATAAAFIFGAHCAGRCLAGLVLTTAVGFLSLPWTAAADAITFDESLALGAGTPVVAEAREMLLARGHGDEKIGGTATATNITFMPGALVSPREAAGFDMQATLTQGWNLRDLGGARRTSASHERQALAAEIRARALRARLGAARRWIDLATLARVIETMDARVSEAELAVARHERALAAGVGTAQPVSEARAMLARLRQHRLDLEGDQFAAATQLAIAVGRSPGATPLRATGELPSPELPEQPDLRARIADSDAVPDVVAERLRETAARARAVEASAQYAPVLTLGAQGERSAFGTWVVYGVSGVTFRGPGQERRLTSVADARAAGATARADGVAIRVRAELEEALHDLRHTTAVLALLEDETLPALRRVVASRRRAVELGEESYFALFDARDQELEAIEAAHRARGAATWARVHMWLLLAELTQGRPTP